ncbi:hypothetical protein ACMWDK_26820, partial [Klebsiella pneumoniae]
MATLQWDHAVQFVNQPEAAIEIFAGQQLRAVSCGKGYFFCQFAQGSA